MADIEQFAKQVAEEFRERQKGTPERFNLELPEKAVMDLVKAAFYASMVTLRNILRVYRPRARLPDLPACGLLLLDYIGLPQVSAAPLRGLVGRCSVLRLQGTSRRPARSVCRGDLRPRFSLARTLSAATATELSEREWRSIGSATQNLPRTTQPFVSNRRISMGLRRKLLLGVISPEEEEDEKGSRARRWKPLPKYTAHISSPTLTAHVWSVSL
jgi:hypothetical protein